MQKIVLYLTALTISVMAIAQECRPLTDKEQQAYSRLIKTLDDILSSKLVNDDWEPGNKRAPEHIQAANNPTSKTIDVLRNSI